MKINLPDLTLEEIDELLPERDYLAEFIDSAGETKSGWKDFVIHTCDSLGQKKELEREEISFRSMILVLLVFHRYLEGKAIVQTEQEACLQKLYKVQKSFTEEIQREEGQR